jgi:hypothetical protein
MQEIIFIVEDDVDGGLTAHALGHSIFTEAASFDELKLAVKDAVQCHFGDSLQRIIRLHYVKEEVFAA